jgi:hypothetical protein
MDKNEEQKKFEELYSKFVHKCIQEGLFPFVSMKYDPSGIYPILEYYVLNEEEKKQMSALYNKKK